MIGIKHNISGGFGYVTGAVEVHNWQIADYQWYSFNSWYDPETGMFYWYEDPGCSCFGPMEDLTEVGDLSVGSKNDLIAAYKRFAEHGIDMDFEERATAEYDIRQAIKEAMKETV